MNQRSLRHVRAFTPLEILPHCFAPGLDFESFRNPFPSGERGGSAGRAYLADLIIFRKSSSNCAPEASGVNPRRSIQPALVSMIPMGV